MFQYFMSGEDHGGYPPEVLTEELRKAKDNLIKRQKSESMSVRAKFTCDSVIPNGFGDGSVTAHFHAVYGTEGENADYSKYTPCGNLNMVISAETKASTYFQQGKNYFLTFEEAQ